jgi:hypothetical protein
MNRSNPLTSTKAIGSNAFNCQLSRIGDSPGSFVDRGCALEEVGAGFTTSGVAIAMERSLSGISV